MPRIIKTPKQRIPSRAPKPRETDPPVERLAMSIRQFAHAHDLSIDTYYRLARAGLGPEIMKVGHKTLISIEAAAAWRRTREAAASEQRLTRKAASTKAASAQA